MASTNNLLRGKIEYGKQAAAVFNARERKMVLQIALEMAGELWIEEYLPRRFNKKYMARAPFNHDPRRLSLKQKIEKALAQGQKPSGGRKKFNFDRLEALVMDGDMRDTALSRSRVKAVSTKGNIKGSIIIPTHHGLRPQTRDLLTTLPRREENRIANKFEREIIRMLNASSIQRTKTGRKSRTGRRTLQGARTTIRTRKLKGLK